LVLLVRAPERISNTFGKQSPDGGTNRMAVRSPAPDASGTRMEARMAAKDAPEAEAGDHEDSIRETLATILEQSRQTLELLRTLIGLILPIVGDREGPPLEDLIATLVAQNRDLLTIARRIQADVRAIGDRLPAGVSSEQNGHGETSGAAGS